MNYVLGVLFIAFVIALLSSEERRHYGCLLLLGVGLAAVGVFTGSPYDK